MRPTATACRLRDCAAMAGGAPHRGVARGFRYSHSSSRSIMHQITRTVSFTTAKHFASILAFRCCPCNSRNRLNVRWEASHLHTSGIKYTFTQTHTHNMECECKMGILSAHFMFHRQSLICYWTVFVYCDCGDVSVDKYVSSHVSYVWIAMKTRRHLLANTATCHIFFAHFYVIQSTSTAIAISVCSMRRSPRAFFWCVRFAVRAPRIGIC